MPVMFGKGLRYIHRYINHESKSKQEEENFDYNFIRKCLEEML